MHVSQWSVSLAETLLDACSEFKFQRFSLLNVRPYSTAKPHPVCLFSPAVEVASENAKGNFFLIVNRLVVISSIFSTE